MRLLLLIVVVGMCPLTSNAGAIGHQYGSGFEGVSWGESMADLVAKRPGGDHQFAHGGGQRDYSISDETPLFGISRGHMHVEYFFDETDSVMAVGVGFPYEQRTKLLGALTLSFGPYKQMIVNGISNVYIWPKDDGTELVVEATLDPSYGMLRVAIFGPNSELLKKEKSNCDKPSSTQKPKR